MFPSKHFADFLSSIITYSAYERYQVKNIDFELGGGGGAFLVHPPEIVSRNPIAENLDTI